MPSDLATALLQGNASPLTADPAMAAMIPQLSLAQAMTQQSLSGAPAYPAQALGRLAQTLVGSKMMDDATAEIGNVYGRAAGSMSKLFPEDTPIGQGLRSNDPYVRMQALQQASKAMLLQSEPKTLSPGQGTYVGSGSTPMQANTGGAAAAAEGAKNPPLIAREAGVAAAKAPYAHAGEVVVYDQHGNPVSIPATEETIKKLNERIPFEDRGAIGRPGSPVSPRAVGTPAGAPKPSTEGVPLPGEGATGKPVETPEFKARGATYGKAGEALGGVIAEHIEAGGKSARDRLNALDSIESAMRANGGKGIITGPQADSILRWRETLNGMGINPDWIKEGMPQSEVIQKMNSQLASASAKAMSGRPTQFEFSTFQKNNPGLGNSREGTLALLDVLRQTANQDVDIGKIAQNKKNWDNIGAATSKYYEEHPLKNPFTGKSMRDEIAAGRAAEAPGGAPAGKSGGGPASFNDRFGAAYGSRGGTTGSASPVHVKTPAEARALPSGTPIILPDGRQGVVP